MFDESGQQAYKGTAIANFPNMFFLVGPNTGLGHTSMVYMIESQINYVVDAIATIDKRGLRHRRGPRGRAGRLQRRPAGQAGASSVWNNGGCASWYLDKHGNNTTLWPDFTFEFRRHTKHFDVAAYDSVGTTSDCTAAARPIRRQRWQHSEQGC